MKHYRLVLLAVVLALMGCASLGLKSGVGYSSDARAALKASRAWVAAPQNQGMLKAATEQCRAAVVKYTSTESAKLHSFASLDLLKSTLETSQTSVDNGEDPTKMWPSTGLCPIDSVKMAQSQLAEELFNEEQQHKLP